MIASDATFRVTTGIKVHTDYRQWDHQHARWLADIEVWQRDHESARSELKALEEILCQHGEALQAHLTALERHDQHLRDHHRAVSEYETYGGGEHELETLAVKHRADARRHKAQHEAHERIRQHHHAVIAQLNKLRAAFEAAM